MKNSGTKINWLVVSILVIVVTAINAPIFYTRTVNGSINDTGSHIVYTYAFMAGKPWPLLNQVHPLIQIILTGMSWISRSRIDPFLGMVILMVACQVALALILYFWLGKLNRKGGDWIRALMAASLTFIAPILALVPLDNKYYFGYIVLANYHNPPVILVRPLALISYYFAFRIFDKPRNPVWMMIVSAVIVILSALAKPNYLMCILPAILVLGIIWSLKKQKWDWWFFIFGFALPGVIILFVQWLLLYGTSSAAGILFNPLVAMHNSAYLVWKFLLSILFPLVATVLLFKKMVKDPYIWLGWIGFIVSSGIFYLFSESGRRMYDLNFSWGTQVMLLLLIASTVRFCLKFFMEEKIASWKRLVIWGIYLLYVASGVVYYIHCIAGRAFE